MVNTLKGEAFGFLGFDLRRVRKRSGDRLFHPDDPEEEGSPGNQSEGFARSSDRRGRNPAQGGDRSGSMPRWPDG